MATNVDVPPSRQIRFFSSFEEQEEHDLRYWRDQPLRAKIKAAGELAEYFARLHKIDLYAQGPKRVVVQFHRSQR
jgi:hypothetical protein